MEIDFNDREKISFRSFLIFSFFLLLILNTGFSLNSTYFRVSEVKVLGVNELFDETDLIKTALGQSIWLISDDTFSDKMLQSPTIENFLIRKEYPNKITIEITEYEVIFIKGIGEVFPYIRSHNLLTNLQKILKNEPSIIFFPGSYHNDPKFGSSLNLFCEFSNDNYYRAFNILTMR